jgi:hypothetical protein
MASQSRKPRSPHRSIDLRRSLSSSRNTPKPTTPCRRGRSTTGTVQAATTKRKGRRRELCAVAPHLSTSSSLEEIPLASPSNPFVVDPSCLGPLLPQRRHVRGLTIRVGRGSREHFDHPPTLSILGTDRVGSIDRSAVVSPSGAKTSPLKPTRCVHHTSDHDGAASRTGGRHCEFLWAHPRFVGAAVESASASLACRLTLFSLSLSCSVLLCAQQQRHCLLLQVNSS